MKYGLCARCRKFFDLATGEPVPALADIIIENPASSEICKPCTDNINTTTPA